MSLLAEFSIVPLGRGASVSAYVARVLAIVAESGVPYKINPMGTVLEGEWETVMTLFRKCHEAVMQDSERVLTTIRIDDRKGNEPRMEQKLASVDQNRPERTDQHPGKGAAGACRQARTARFRAH
jgi:uncharacterized protein (TIGR00106 family)